MKQLLFLLLFPAFAMAQYPGNAGQKITLGEQTTADGLVFRGVASIDTVTATSKITRANKQDTSAYLLLDTVTNLLWHYKIGSNAWTQAGGGVSVSSFSAGTTGLTPSTATTGAVTLGGTLAVENGGTGSGTKNFVDLTTTQSIGGAKTFTSNISINTSGQSRTISTFYSSGSDGNNIFIGGGGNSSTTGGGASYLGSYNSAIGVNALYLNTTGYYNSALGLNALRSNTTGYYNSALGLEALYSNTTGNNNSAIGVNALRSNTTGYFNSAIGVNALYSNTTGYNNFALGLDALYSNTTGYYNSAIGVNALYSNTTGNNNSAIGVDALRSNTTGYFNSAIGVSALYSNTTGYNNSALGLEALRSNTTGANNSAIGVNAGYGTGTNANTTGSNNTFIGYESVGASETASNVITLGNSSIATIRSQVTSITSLSDIRDKTHILPLNYGMSFIDKLKPVSFVWDMRDGGKIGIPEIGFIAQDLQQAQIDTGINVPNLVSGVDEKLEASYGVLLPIIVKALQEANEKIKSLEKRLLILENK